MRTQYVEAFRYGLFPDLEHGDGFVHPHTVYLVSLLQSGTALHQALQFLITFGAYGVDYGVNAFPFCLAVVQEISVFLIQFFKLCQLLLIVNLPGCFSFHFLFPFLIYISAPAYFIDRTIHAAKAWIVPGQILVSASVRHCLNSIPICSRP